MKHWIQNIIRRMQLYARRIWSILLPAFFVLIGAIVSALILLDGKSYQWLVLVVLGVLAVACLTVSIILLVYDGVTTHRKDRILAISRQLREYLIEMKRLENDSNRGQHEAELQPLIKDFNALETKIEEYLKHMIPEQVEYWNKPIADGGPVFIGYATKEHSRQLEVLVDKYANLNT
jgi:hypothetical protein